MQNMNAQMPNADAQWYDAMSQIGGAVFGNMAGATKDGEYQGQKMKDMEGYDSKLSDKENYFKLFPQSGLNTDLAKGYIGSDNVANFNNGINYVPTDGDNTISLGPLNSISNYQFASPPQSSLTANIGYKPDWRNRIGGIR